MTKRIYLSSPHMSDEGYEMEYVKEAFDINPIISATQYAMQETGVWVPRCTK